MFIFRPIGPSIGDIWVILSLCSKKHALRARTHIFWVYMGKHLFRSEKSWTGPFALAKQGRWSREVQFTFVNSQNWQAKANLTSLFQTCTPSQSFSFPEKNSQTESKLNSRDLCPRMSEPSSGKHAECSFDNPCLLLPLPELYPICPHPSVCYLSFQQNGIPAKCYFFHRVKKWRGHCRGERKGRVSWGENASCALLTFWPCE